MDDEVAEWLAQVNLVVGDLSTDWMDGYKFGKILIKLEVLDSDEAADCLHEVKPEDSASDAKDKISENYDYLVTALEHVNIELPEATLTLIKEGDVTSTTSLLSRLFDYSKSLAKSDQENGQNTLHLASGKRVSTLIRHSQTYSQALADSAMTINPLLSASSETSVVPTAVAAAAAPPPADIGGELDRGESTFPEFEVGTKGRKGGSDDEKVPKINSEDPLYPSIKDFVSFSNDGNIEGMTRIFEQVFQKQLFQKPGYFYSATALVNVADDGNDLRSNSLNAAIRQGRVEAVKNLLEWGARTECVSATAQLTS